MLSLAENMKKQALADQMDNEAMWRLWAKSSSRVGQIPMNSLYEYSLSRWKVEAYRFRDTMKYSTLAESYSLPSIDRRQVRYVQMRSGVHTRDRCL